MTGSLMLLSAKDFGPKHISSQVFSKKHYEACLRRFHNKNKLYRTEMLNDNW